jgi:hypothetical protein
MPDPSISEDDALRVTRSYLDRMYRQPPPRDIEGEVMRSILAPRSRRSIPVVRLAASGLMVVAIAAVACVALLVHSGRSSTAGASAGWSIVSNSTTAAENSGLTAVTCVSADDCWAVGGSATGTLIEHYGDGGGWTAVSSANATDGAKGELQAVTCAGAGDCWAVGVSLTATSGAQTLIEQYQGSGWSVVASPNPADGSGPQLNSVSCDGAGDCWAVGWFVDAPGSTRTESPLIEQDQGSGWSIAPSPNLSSNSDTQLQAVTCVSAGACWAVGFPSGPNGQVVMHENGQPAG